MLFNTTAKNSDYSLRRLPAPGPLTSCARVVVQQQRTLSSVVKRTNLVISHEFLQFFWKGESELMLWPSIKNKYIMPVELHQA